MVRELYSDARKGINSRQNLSRLRQEVKDDAKMNDLFELVENDMQGMATFLADEDPKVRKNAALLMGELDMSDFTAALVDGYRKEEQLFVRSAYLEALKNYNIEEYLGLFKERVCTLQSMPVTEENKKHIGEELKALTELIVSVEGITRHEFTGWNKLNEDVECILLTNVLNKAVTEEQLKEQNDVELIPFRGGVRFRTGKLNMLRNIRTYREVLFVIPDFAPCEFEPVTAAVALSKSGLCDLLARLHSGKGDGSPSASGGGDFIWPFYFRLELKSGLDMEKRSRFAKRFAAELERLTNRQLINSTSDYEIELRLIEGRDGKLNALVKLYTMQDDRFSYYKKHVATSLKPVNAALIVELAKGYMAEDAQVLDPFCGVGTMLIERQKVVKANTSYGLDINAEAIEGAKVNTEAAGQIIHYINRDFFTFEHDYLFDEIFTDMPFSVTERGQAEIEHIYSHFFNKAGKVMKKGGRIIMYSRNPQLAVKYGRKAGYKLIEQCRMSQKDDNAVLIFDDVNA